MSKFASGGQTAIFNADGSQASFPILDGYASSDGDESDGTYNYYGFLKADGSWYIMRTTKNNSAIRYFAGSSDYATSWTGKAALSYDLFNIIF